MIRLLLCTVCLGLTGCATSPLIPSKMIAMPSKTCIAEPMTAPVIKAGDDVVVDDAKMRKIIGAESDAHRACQTYIKRIRQG